MRRGLLGSARVLRHRYEDVPRADLVLRVLGLRGVRRLHLFVRHLARLDLEAQHLGHQRLAPHRVPRRLPRDPLLLERLAEVGDLHALLPRELLERALQLLFRNRQAERRRFRLDQLLVDQLGEAAVEQVRALLVAMRTGGLLHHARQLGPDALLHVREQDRLTVHHRRDALLDLGARGGGAEEHGEDETLHRA